MTLGEEIVAECGRALPTDLARAKMARHIDTAISEATATLREQVDTLNTDYSIARNDAASWEERWEQQTERAKKAELAQNAAADTLREVQYQRNYNDDMICVGCEEDYGSPCKPDCPIAACLNFTASTPKHG